MKKAFKSILWPIAALFALSLASCSEKIEQPGQEEPEVQSTVKTCPMVFQGGVVGFDQNISSSATKGTSSNWSDGDKIYIIFYNGSTKVPGEGTYSTSGGWNVSYDGDLATGTGLKCEVRYFANATFYSSSLVSLNSATEIYETTSGTYEYNGTTLTVSASMTPKTGRIRFTGTASSKIYLTGIAVYTTYSPALNTFSTSNAMITTTVSSTGTTPYIYGAFSDSDRKLGLVGSNFAYTRTCSADVLKVGDSGYMAIPSETSHNNWKSGLYVKVSGVEFKMIPVSGLSSGFFLIGETEVTNALYKVVTSTSSWTSNNKPAVGLDYSYWTNFITQINYATNLTFSIPSSAQWKHAAKGGSLSQGYKYAGSNTPGDVAWYAGNSGNALHDVKQLAPNELGIYDMSGNAMEWVTDVYSSSYSGYHDYYGGYYSSSESGIGITSKNGNMYSSSSSTVNYITLRVVLTCN